MLPEHDVVVVDEAHELVDRVTGVATDELTAPMVERAARRARRLVDGTEDLTDAAGALEAALDALPEGRVVDLPEQLATALALVRDAARDGRCREIGRGQGRRRRRPQGGAWRAVGAVHDTAERLAAHSPYDVTWIVARPAPRLGAEGRAAVGQRPAARGAVRRALGGDDQRDPRARRVASTRSPGRSG